MMNGLRGWGGHVPTYDEQFEGLGRVTMNSLRGWGGRVAADDEQFEGMGRACAHRC